jgi:hypothetical protein
LVVGGGHERAKCLSAGRVAPKASDLSRSATKPDTAHYPYARPRRGGWQKQPDGTWKSTIEDPHEWEVICEQCGDKSGRFEDQPEAATELRGPYNSKHKATHIAKKHFDRFRKGQSS